MSFLLDINVLISRTDPNHVYHQAALDWFGGIGKQTIVTCPIVENGFVRIFGNPNYPGGPGSVAKALENLQWIRSIPQHRFLEDCLSIDRPAVFRDLEGVSCKQLTDIYLLGLAAEKGLNFATFDRRIMSDRVLGGRASLEVIDVP